MSVSVPLVRLAHAIIVSALALGLSGCQSVSSSSTGTSTSATSSPADTFFANPFTIGVRYDQPGFGTSSKTDYQGFDPALGRELAAALHVTPVFVGVNDTQREAGLNNGSLKLVIANYTITQTRENGGNGVQAVDFAGPYLQSPEALLVQKSGPYDANDPNIDHARICAVQGSAADQIPLPNPQGKSHGTTYADCVNLLENGKVDAVITGWLVLYGYIQSGLYPNLAVVLTHYGDIQEYGIGLPYGDRAACVAIAGFLRGYVGTTQWADDLETNFSDIAKNYPGPRSTGTDWRDPFMPSSPNGYQANCK